MTSTGVSSSQWSTCLISFGASRSTMEWRRRASIGMASSRTPPRVRDVTRFGGTNRLRSRTSYTFAPERLTAFPLRSRRVVGRLGLSDDMIVFLPEVAECSVCMSFPHDRISCLLWTPRRKSLRPSQGSTSPPLHLSSTTCLVRTSPSTILHHRPPVTRSPER